MAQGFLERLEQIMSAHEPQHVSIPGARAAAVLVPLLEDPEPSLIFTVRTDTLPSHKGQISFPGGSIDPTDPSPEAAALRETQEEIGLDPSAVRVIGELDTTPTFVSGYVITPIVGWLAHRPELQPNPAEVADVLEVPLADLTDEIRREPGFSHSGQSYPTEAWIWNGHVIWGVTARLLRLLLTRLAEAGLVQPPGATDGWTAWPLRSITR
jgi:8-oxo-dGTP pyrophosphatase MutT (NUDIX family)